DEVVRLHEQHGFKAELRQANSGQELVLKRCPFQDVATTYQTVVCSVHLGLIRGALGKLATGVNADRLEPLAEPRACLRHLHPPPPGEAASSRSASTPSREEERLDRRPALILTASRSRSGIARRDGRRPGVVARCRLRILLAPDARAAGRTLGRCCCVQPTRD